MLCGWVPKEIPCPSPLFCSILLSFEFIGSPRLLLPPRHYRQYPRPHEDSVPKSESEGMRE